TVSAGDTLARMPRETAKTSDIVTGLPRVTELFEARKPKDHATISEITGAVSFQGMSRGMQVVRVTPVDETAHKDYKIPLGKFIIVQEGDFVEAGDPLTDGSLNPHDILDVKGKEEVQKYLVKQIKEVYRRQGEHINDKHVEAIIRQMMKKVRITEEGDSDFLQGDEISINAFRAANHKVMSGKVRQMLPVAIEDADQYVGSKLALDAGDAKAGDVLTAEILASLKEAGVSSLDMTIERGGRPAEAAPLLQGITKASLSTESFISAASFQQTTNVLTKAAALGKRDSLRGLKENVIMGRLIPAGTGMPRHRRIRVDATRLQGKAPALEASNDDDD
ncbi:MAG: DNA-directed RNA polymerase subunit beta', partial [Candidatus Poribacteria bacterium]|nr:DNA-directed RNA polymerase subunit beta' [Candidatus Poribacteria bacterium]